MNGEPLRMNDERSRMVTKVHERPSNERNMFKNGSCKLNDEFVNNFLAMQLHDQPGQNLMTMVIYFWFWSESYYHGHKIMTRFLAG